MGLNVHTYFLPFYFQSAQGISAEQSGTRLIPYLITMTIVSIGVGVAVGRLGLYIPFMLMGSVIFTIASGLIHTLGVDTPAGNWIGYQILAGTGTGSTLQLVSEAKEPFFWLNLTDAFQSAVSIQAALSSQDMPIGNAFIVFFQYLGSSLAVSVAQSIFSNALRQKLADSVPGVDPDTIIKAGATNIPAATAPQNLSAVVEAYNYAVDRAFILSIAAGGVALLSIFGMEWKNLKSKPEVSPVTERRPD